MIDFSPKGILEASIVFPIMGFFALLLDAISVVLMIFGLDDMGLLDITGFVIFGSWVFIRSGGEKEIEAPKRLEEKTREKIKKSAGKAMKRTMEKGTEEIPQKAAKKGGKLLSKLAKVAAKALPVTIVEFIPYLGAIVFGWTALVLFEFISDLRKIRF